MPTPGRVPERSPECAAIITHAAEALERRSDEVVDQLIAYALDGLEPMREESLAEALVAAARGIVPLLTAMARAWVDPHVVPPPHDSVVLARTLVARDLSITVLLRALRLGQAAYQQLWHREITSAGAPADVTLEAVSACTAFIFVWIDAISEPLVAAYEEERARRAGALEAVRAKTVADILAGQEVDPGVAGARMGYELKRSHIGAILWVEPGSGAVSAGRLPELGASVAGRLAAAASSPYALTVAAGPRAMHVWAHSDRAPGDLPAELRTLLHGTSVRVAVGGAGHGVDGFRQTHAEAQRARRVAVHLRRRAAVTCYTEDVAVCDLLIRDPVAARDVATRMLGPLAAPDDKTRRLLATLTVFVEEGGSIARTARRLGLHKNTVAYRLRRAAELSGHPDANSASLQTAVRLAPLLDADAER